MTKTEPRILLYDIETTPIIGYTWGKWQQNVIDIQDDWHILCFAWKWLGEDETHIVSQRQFERSYARNRKDDRQVVQELHRLFAESDIRVAHNGDKFDEKKVKSRFALHNLGNVPHAHTIDTVKVSRRHFAETSHSLNDVCRRHGIGKKIPHQGFDLWLGCMAGLDEAWDTMEKYNVQDIALLEGYYLFLRNGGWMDQHPNVAIISGDLDGCKACGSHRLQKRGTRKTTAHRYQQYQCQECGTYQRGRNALPDTRSITT